jgi:hypothetical protein
LRRGRCSAARGAGVGVAVAVGVFVGGVDGWGVVCCRLRGVVVLVVVGVVGRWRAGGGGLVVGWWIVGGGDGWWRVWGACGGRGLEVVGVDGVLMAGRNRGWAGGWSKAS